jgi:hypothetical protein
MKKSAAAAPQPFFNPHLLVTSDGRLEAETALFQRLLQGVSAHLFNSGAAGADKIKEVLGLS